MNVQNLVLEMAGTIVSLKDLRKLAWVTVKQLMQFVSMQLKERESNEYMIYNVLHVPKLACNLFSVREQHLRANLSNLAMTNAGYIIIIEQEMFVAQAHW